MRALLRILPLTFLLTIPAVMRADTCATTTLNNVLGTTCTIGNVTYTFDNTIYAYGYGASAPAASTLQFLPFAAGNEQGFKITGVGGATGQNGYEAYQEVVLYYGAAPNGTSFTGIGTSTTGGSTGNDEYAGAFNYQCFNSSCYWLMSAYWQGAYYEYGYHGAYCAYDSAYCALPNITSASNGFYGWGGEYGGGAPAQLGGTAYFTTADPVQSPVPEPTALPLMASGLAVGWGLFRRKLLRR
jgi:hypothetical protein